VATITTKHPPADQCDNTSTPSLDPLKFHGPKSFHNFLHPQPFSLHLSGPPGHFQINLLFVVVWHDYHDPRAWLCRLVVEFLGHRLIS